MIRFERSFLWAGGAVFVLALAASTLTYLITWSEPSTSGGATAIAADVALVGVFAFHHSLFARETVKTHMARVLPSRLLRSLYVWTASLLLLIVLAFWQPVAGEAYRITGWGALLCAGIQLAGLWLIARAVAKIDALELAGIKQPSPASTSSDGLQVRGPYRLVRHPLYSGWILAVFGAAAMTANRLTFAVITTAYLLVAIPWEERSLERAFGDGYARYRQQVRWRVVPFIY